MKRNYRVSLSLMCVAVILLAALINACSFGPSFSEMTTASEFVSAFQPADKTNYFFIDSPQVCFSAKLESADDNTEITSRWVYVKGDLPVHTDSVIGTGKIRCSNGRYFGFTLTAPAQGFTSGEYKVELYISGQRKAQYTFYIQKEKGTIPQIRSYTLNPLNLTKGDSAELSWQVENASRVSIMPEPGTLTSSGQMTISPDKDTTYTIWAINRSGVSSSSLSVKVREAVTEKADLVIVDFWYTGTTIYYIVKNIGSLASKGSESYLYKNDVQVSEDYIEPLGPGQERTELFSVYHFTPRFGSVLNGAISEATSDAVNMRICLNANSAFPESDIDNNCMEHNFGPLLDVGLHRYAPTAQWQSSAGNLKWPMLKSSAEGWATVAPAHVGSGMSYPNSIIMTLPVMANSWIEARFGLSDDGSRKLQPFYIPHKAKLSAKVGLTADAPESSSVKFILGTAQGGDITYYPPVVINAKGKLERYEVDLSKLAGKSVEFILRVESSTPLQQGSAVWIDPSFYQEL